MADNVICSNCKTTNHKDDKFCLECGRPLGGKPTAKLPGKQTANDSPAQAGGSTGTRPLSKNTSFLPRPIQAVFGDRFLGNNLIHSDEKQHGYLVAEMTEEGVARISQCANPECGAVHIPFNEETESYCTACSAPLTDSQLALVLFEARSQIFGNAPKVAEMGLTHTGIRAPVAAFKETVAGENRFCLVIPYVEPLSTNFERNQVFQWGITLATALGYLHQNGLTYDGQVSQETFNMADGKAVIANFHKSKIVESVSGKSRAADMMAFAGVLFKWLTGRSQYAHDPGLAPIVSEFFETALKPPGFATAEIFAQSLESALRETTAVQPVDHKLGRLTDVGVARSLNEDSLLTIQVDKYLESVPTPLGVYVVADGMGGHSAGEVASGIIVNSIAEMAFTDLMSSNESVSSKERCKWIVNTMQEANKAVYDMGRKMGSDMGSTIVMALAEGNTVCTGHVGDSRAYLINNQGIKPLTTDHSLVERLIETGQITREEARQHPQRNVIYRTMGDKAKLEVDTASHNFNPGDRLLLCSDGLNGMVEDEMMRQIVMEDSKSPQEACDMLVQAANAAGGDDNITVVILEMV
jgi:protein phosphatase